MKFVRQQEVIFQLAGRAGRRLQETMIIWIAVLAASLCNIGGYGGGRPADLTYQPKLLVAREFRCRGVCRQSQLVGFFPYVQLTEISHPTRSFLPMPNH